MVKANKGEWSEPYVAIRLLGDGRLYLADAFGNKNSSEWMSVLDVMRYETTSQIVKYSYDADKTLVTVYVNSQKVIEVLASDFLKCADKLRDEIVESTGRSFSVSDAILDFFKKVKIDKNHLKAISKDKSDIFLSISDPRASIVRKNVGFSIKSKFGQNPTLFNTAKASASVYKLNGMTDSLMEEINQIVTIKGHADVRKRCEKILQSCKVKFCGYPLAAKANCAAFAENLDLIDSRLKLVIPHILYNLFFLSFTEVDIDKVVKKVIEDNPCDITRPEVKYPFMVKSFLYAVYCGMTASTLWDGNSKVNGGFITVSEQGEVLANYALESDTFKNYLYQNCFIETPSTSPKHGDYGYVYKVNGEYFFKLNFQIRFK